MTVEKVSRISVSLPPSLLKSFDNVSERAGIVDRSKAVQMALRAFIMEHESVLEVKAPVSGVILLAYDPEVRGLEKVLVEAQHKERNIISSSLHNHLDERTCLEAVMVHGHPAKVGELAQTLGRQRGVEFVKTLFFRKGEL